MVEIQRAAEDNIRSIRQLADITWQATYTSILSPAQMAYMLNLFYSTTALKEQMQQHQFIIAINNEDAVGFASYSSKPEQENKRHGIPTIYHLHKLYVHPNQQGKGTGKMLLDFIIMDIRSKGAASLELNVNRYNNALSFYQKAGFTILKEIDINIGNGYFMNDYVMRCEL